MKNLIIIVSLVFCFQGFSQRKPKIKGNKNVVVVEDVLPDFSSIELKDDLDITLQQSDEPGYFIEADDNLIDILKFKVTGNTLEISCFYKVTSKKKFDIIIRFRDLDGITLQEGKLVVKDKITVQDELQISTYNSSKLELLASAAIVDINMEGNSSADLNIEADSVSINLKERVDARIYSVSETNSIEMRKNASVRMEGSSDILNINLFDSANFKGSRLEASEVKLDIEGSSNADVNALSEFELSSRGTAKTHLYGSSSVSIIKFLDKSQLHKEN
ncbi:DUF2807 domain-containing protein [Aurantibacter crassamenti]|uniref:GIN domain-containing protein n=1 Tax=Aurantibacter crassamenti TaxID=1837375 RepID=UPI00193A5AEA|nr:DUF2807 domain-containing protein [Aurantibacter crassamenti]MBM1105970.1 DUF2807 domain-containing protein [Aurantibacter crassamenti]